MRDLLRYPVRGAHAEEALLVGWICLLAHLLFVPVVPLVPAVGYLVAVLRSTVEDEGEGEQGKPPAVEYRMILRQGAIGTVLVTIYGLVPVAVGATTLRLAGATTLDPGAGGSLLFLVGSTTTLFVLLGFLYVLPIALCGYTREGPRGAIPGSGFVRVGGHAAYFVGWTAALALLAVGWLVGAAIASLPVLGPVFAALWWWYVLLVTARRIGLADRATR